uniref:Uncharacterized protein n=1 Tax=Oreochromis niloticus TaxID=8128 RepID=A0A669CDG2_ORENI
QLKQLLKHYVVLYGDDRCDPPGHSAKYCIYTFLDAQSTKICGLQLVSVTQVSNCNAMEIKGFKEALKTIEEHKVKVSTISTDRHPQIVKEMRVSNPEKLHEFDPWHVTKGVSKELAAESKRKVCEEKGLRRSGSLDPSIINHLWWSTQTCEGGALLLKEKWISVIHHVTIRHDWPGNRHYQQCAHNPLDDTVQRCTRADCDRQALPLHHDGPVQRPHHCSRSTNPSVDLRLPSPITREQDPEVLELLHLGQELIPDPEWALHPFPAENHGLRFGGADPHSRCFTLGCEPLQCELEAFT